MAHSQLQHEIYAQPQVTQAILSQRPLIRQIADIIQQYQPRFVMIAARGTSDNAARYAQYLFGMRWAGLWPWPRQRSGRCITLIYVLMVRW